MKFARDFVNAMDGTGRALLSFNNRPGTSGSLMSERPSVFLRPQTADPVTLPSIHKPGTHTLPAAGSGQTERDAGQPFQPQQIKSRQKQKPAKVNGIGLPEELNSIPPIETTDRPTASILPPESTLGVENPYVNHSCSGHIRAGQELCYLCYQRAQKNVPLYLSEQRQAEERAQEFHLLLKEEEKDWLYLQKEQADMKEQRDNAKQVAAFNLGVAEAAREGKALCPQYFSSFIFRDRPLTAQRQAKQRVYMEELQAQLSCKRQMNTQIQQDTHLLDCLEQARLDHEIASHKQLMVQQKQEDAKTYKRALDTQVEEKKDRSLSEPAFNNSGFGRIEAPASITESRERAKEVFHEQLTTANQKRREEFLKRQEQQEKEREMLSRNRRQLIIDRINRFEKMRNLRVSLEDTWRHSAILKLQRDEEEKRFRGSGGHLLIDQCQQYRRCHQCKRRTSNCGESNVWRDSYYKPRSHLMI